MKTIVVFGATGNLGAYIALHMNEQGYNVIAVGHRKSDNGFFKSKGMSYYSVDIRDRKAFEVLPTDEVFAVAHFAGSLPSRYEFDAVDLFESITIGTLNVLDWMRTVGCKKIVFPQTPADMARFHNQEGLIPSDAPRQFPLTGDHAIYTIAKNAAIDLMEHYRAEYGIHFFALRFFTIYQYHPNAYHFTDFKRRMMPYRMLMDRAIKGLPIEIWGDCKKAKEMVYVKDMVRLVQCCIESDKDGGCYNCGNGWQVSLEEQILGIVDVFSQPGKRSPVIYCPDKPDPRQNGLDMTKTFADFPNYRPQYSYIEQLRDFKREMDEEPMALLWGTKDDYCE